MSKPKYDKYMCLKCIYHQETPGTGFPIVVKDNKGRENPDGDEQLIHGDHGTAD